MSAETSAKLATYAVITNDRVLPIIMNFTFQMAEFSTRSVKLMIKTVISHIACGKLCKIDN